MQICVVSQFCKLCKDNTASQSLHSPVHSSNVRGFLEYSSVSSDGADVFLKNGIDSVVPLSFCIFKLSVWIVEIADFVQTLNEQVLFLTFLDQFDCFVVAADDHVDHDWMRLDFCSHHLAVCMCFEFFAKRLRLNSKSFVELSSLSEAFFGVVCTFSDSVKSKLAFFAVRLEYRFVYFETESFFFECFFVLPELSFFRQLACQQRLTWLALI